MAIVVDCANEERISAPGYEKCREVIKIDHHPERAENRYGNIRWVDDTAGSASEMITDMCMKSKGLLEPDKKAAEALFAGIVTDTGRFKFSPSPKMMECAAYLLGRGADASLVYDNVYLVDPGQLKFQAYVLGHFECTPNGVAHIYITSDIMKEFGRDYDGAAESVTYLESLKGVICWIVFIDDTRKPGDIRVRLRSRYVAVNGLASRYGGGGHANASGATLSSPSEIEGLLREADALVREYKKNNTGWR